MSFRLLRRVRHDRASWVLLAALLLARCGAGAEGGGATGPDVLADSGAVPDARDGDLRSDGPSPPDGPLPDAGDAGDTSVPLGPCDEPPPQGMARVRKACLDPASGGLYLAERAGDLVLENHRVRYTIRTGASEGLMIMGTGPGGLVDAVPVVNGRFAFALDRVLELAPLLGLRTLANPVVTRGSGGPGEPAFVRVSGDLSSIPIAEAVLPGLGTAGRGSITWTLRPDSQVIEVALEVAPETSDKPVSLVGLAVLHGGDLEPYLEGQGIASGKGGKSPMVGGISQDYSIGVGADAGEDLTFVAAGTLSLVIMPTVTDKEAGIARASGRFAVVPGDLTALRTAMSAEGDPRMPVVVALSGASPFPERPLVVEQTPAGGVLTRRSPIDAEGKARLDLEPGPHELRLAWVEGPAGAPTVVDVPDPAEASTSPLEVSLAPPPAALLRLRAEDAAEPGIGLPARVHLVGAKGADRFVLGPGGGSRLVAPGSWDLTFVRGHEYDLDPHNGIILADGATVEITGRLDRVVDTAGWVACDFHLHSEWSTDSSVPLGRRILEVAAEGLEFVASTDHDYLTDYGPLRDAQGLKPYLQVVVGVEASHPTHGHVGSWPWVPDGARSGNGAPNWGGLTPKQRFELLGMNDPGRIFQLNHPRGSSGHFSAIGYDPDTGLATRTAKSLGYPEGSQLTGFAYDAIEIFNGKRTGDIEQVFTDWRSLIAQGFHPAPLGTSDSHSSGAYPGSARTYVWVGEGVDDPATIAEADVRAGILAGRTLVVGGAFVEAWLVGPDWPDGAAADPPSAVGQVRHEATVEARLRVRVQAPPWMPAERLRIYRNRELVRTEDLATAPGPGAPVLRHDEVHLLTVTGDSFFSVEIDSAAAPQPYLRRPPVSLTSALYLDADGDGVYTPPGLGTGAE